MKACAASDIILYTENHWYKGYPGVPVNIWIMLSATKMNEWWRKRESEGFPWRWERRGSFRLLSLLNLEDVKPQNEGYSPCCWSHWTRRVDAQILSNWFEMATLGKQSKTSVITRCRIFSFREPSNVRNFTSSWNDLMNHFLLVRRIGTGSILACSLEGGLSLLFNQA